MAGPSNAQTQRHLVEVTNTEGREGGFNVDNELIVVEVVPGGLVDGQIQVGDRIVAIGGIPVNTPEEANNEFLKSPTDMKIEVERSTPQGLQTTAEDVIPVERERVVVRRKGFKYRLVNIQYVKGCKFGLGIKHSHGKVFVTRIDPGSLAANALEINDRIFDIDGVPVNDKDVCRDLLIHALKTNKAVTLVIERAIEPDTKQAVEDDMLASCMQPPSVAMASDVREILTRERMRMFHRKAAPSGKKVGLLTRIGNVLTQSGGSSRRRHNHNVKIAPQEKETVIIASDTEGKMLRKVKE